MPAAARRVNMLNRQMDEHDAGRPRLERTRAGRPAPADRGVLSSASTSSPPIRSPSSRTGDPEILNTDYGSRSGPARAAPGGRRARRPGRDGWRRDRRSRTASSSNGAVDGAALHVRLPHRAHRARRAGAERHDRRHQRALAAGRATRAPRVVRRAGGVHRTRAARAERRGDHRPADDAAHAAAVRRRAREGSRARRTLRLRRSR